jgi:hypothetical protein
MPEIDLTAAACVSEVTFGLDVFGTWDFGSLLPGRFPANTWGSRQAINACKLRTSLTAFPLRSFTPVSDRSTDIRVRQLSAKTRHSLNCRTTANKAMDPLSETCHFNQDATRFSNRQGTCGSLA